MILGKKNVVLLTIDCLRADHLGCYGYKRKTSPFIDTLASNGLLYKQAISHGGGTPEAFPSILASVPPPFHHSQYEKLYASSISLPELLRSQGYRTAAFHSNPYVSRVFHYDKGFDIFEDGIQTSGAEIPEPINTLFVKVGRLAPAFILRIATRAGLMNPPITRAKQLSETASSFATETKGSFFLWVHFMDVHSPRMPPLEYIKRFRSTTQRSINSFALRDLQRIAENRPHMISRNDREKIIDIYDASIRYVDDSIRGLYRSLSERFGDTYFLLTSDHGEALGEHGEYGHRSALFDYVIRVPLIISGPDVKRGVVKKQVGLRDVGKTILELLGLSELGQLGENSIIPDKDDNVHSEGVVTVTLEPRRGVRAVSYRTESFKYVRNERIKDGNLISHHIFDLKKDANEIKAIKLHRNEPLAKHPYEVFLDEATKRISQMKMETMTILEKGRLKRRIKGLMTN